MILLAFVGAYLSELSEQCQVVVAKQSYGPEGSQRKINTFYVCTTSSKRDIRNLFSRLSDLSDNLQ